MTSEGIEPAIPAFERRQTQALERKGTGTGRIHFQSGKIQQLEVVQ